MSLQRTQIRARERFDAMLHALVVLKDPRLTQVDARNLSPSRVRLGRGKATIFAALRSLRRAK